MLRILSYPASHFPRFKYQWLYKISSKSPSAGETTCGTFHQCFIESQCINRPIVRHHIEFAFPDMSKDLVSSSGLDYGCVWMRRVERSRPAIGDISAFFIVRKVDAALAFYRGMLGFKVTFRLFSHLLIHCDQISR
jgi:hypothetical protein